jgi:hypothetical protein
MTKKEQEEPTGQELANSLRNMLAEIPFNIPARMAGNYVLITKWIDDIAEGRKKVVDVTNS